VVAALIWEKARIYAHFAQHVDSSVCEIRTWYDSSQSAVEEQI